MDLSAWPAEPIFVDCRASLGDRVCVVRDDVAPPAGDHVVYRASEVLDLHRQGVRREHLVVMGIVHEMKRLGLVAGAVPRPRRRREQAEIQELWARWGRQEREVYLAARAEAFALGLVDEKTATAEQRVQAASWAAERVDIWKERGKDDGRLESQG